MILIVRLVFASVVSLRATEIGPALTVLGNVSTRPVTIDGELHRDVAEVLAVDVLSPRVREVLELVAPEPPLWPCRLERWDQYAVCTESFAQASEALSFGINGQDSWAAYVHDRHGFMPSTFDCFNVTRPRGFPNHFYPRCLGTPAGMRRQKGRKRRYTTLDQELAEMGARPALVKMDVEGEEFDVLEALGDERFAQLYSLHVEYHFNYICPTDEDIRRAVRVLRRVGAHLAVVDSAAAYYFEPCRVNGTPFPKLLAVNYRGPRPPSHDRGYFRTAEQRGVRTSAQRMHHGRSR